MYYDMSDGDDTAIGMLVKVITSVCWRMNNDWCAGYVTTICVLVMVLRLMFW